MYCGRASRTSRGGREEVSDGALLVGARGCSVRCGGLVGCIAWKRTRRATDSVMTATDDDRPRAASERGRASTHLCLWGGALWLGGAVDGLAHARHGRLVAALCARREERRAQRVGRRGEGRRWGEGGLDGGALDEDSGVRLVEREQAGAAVAWPALRQTRGGTERARAAARGRDRLARRQSPALERPHGPHAPAAHLLSAAKLYSAPPTRLSKRHPLASPRSPDPPSRLDQQQEPRTASEVRPFSLRSPLTHSLTPRAAVRTQPPVPPPP